MLVGCAREGLTGTVGLQLDAPVVPIAQGIEVARMGWGPFRQICQQTEVAESNSRLGAQRFNETICVNFSAIEQADDQWRVELSGFNRPAEKLFIVFYRSNAGEIRNAEVIGEGLMRLDSTQRAQIQDHVRTTIQNIGYSRRVFTQGSMYRRDVPPFIGVGPWELWCTISGRSTIDRRDVLVSDCTGRLSIAVEDKENGSIFFGRSPVNGMIAVDIITGIIVGTKFEGKISGNVVDAARGTRREHSMDFHITSRVR